MACTSSTPDFVADQEGNRYAVQTYGDRIWMTENLQSRQDTSGQAVVYYYPNADSNTVATYGLLYDYPTACSLCPSGWRLPTNADWEALLAEEGGPLAHPFKDSLYWQGEQNSNQAGFSLRPAGYGNNGEFDNFFAQKTYLWSITKDNEHDVWAYIAEQGKDSIRSAPQHPTYAFAVRCVKDK